MSIRFPNESPQYRAARDELLKAEAELRKQLEAVADQRRRLPLGGAIEKDYVFDEGDRSVTLSELFGQHDTLMVYSFMFGPKMKNACPSCTSLIDGYDAVYPHVTRNVSFVVVARSPIARVREFAKQRGWRHVRLLSSEKNDYNRDYHGESEDGDQMPMMNVFTKRDGAVHHTWATELLFADSEPGQDPRHVDLVWPLWGLLDMTPNGRGDFNPELSYEK